VRDTREPFPADREGCEYAVVEFPDSAAPDWQVQWGLLDALPEAAVAIDRDGRVLGLNRAGERFFGWARDEIAGNPVAEALFDDPQRGGVAEVLGLVLEGTSWSGDLPVVDRAGRSRAVAMSVRPVHDQDRVAGALLLAGDVVTGEARARRLADRLTRLARVTTELLLARTEEDVTTIVVDHMADAAGATVASLSLLVDRDTLALIGMRGGRAGATSRWATYAVADVTPAGDAVRTGQVLVLGSAAEIRERYPDVERAAEGERSMVCLPLKVGERVLGVATMSFPGRRSFDPAELEFLTIMADTCAQALERVRAMAEAADQAAKIHFLADASLELSSSLDYEVTLGKVARLAVPWFADWCSIAVDQDGELRTLAVAHDDPEKVAMAEELQRRYPPDPDATTGAYQVFRSGQSELTPDITDEMLQEVIDDPELLGLIRGLNFRSALAVPLKVGDRVLGVVTWVAGDQGRRFSEDDLLFGEDLARRAAIAIDTAALHSQLRDVAMRLQRAILPADLPELPGWETAASYLQAGHSDAGGDFYDVIALGDGRLALFVGDVMGRGVSAAAAMAQMRAAIRALVAVEPDAGAVLVALDQVFEQYDFHQLVTMVYAIVDPARDELVVANAGHPPPVLRRADGTVEVVEAEPGLLLGAGGGDRTPITVPFREGDLLVSYTDGLIERRDEDIDAGVRRLARACGAFAGDQDLLTGLAEVIATVRDVRRDDDVAVLALRRARAVRG
jgi:PAS domain S-box-containing protein